MSPLCDKSFRLSRPAVVAPGHGPCTGCRATNRRAPGMTGVGLDRRALGLPPGNNRRRTDCGGKPFKIYKFRTMAPHRRAPQDGDEVWAQPDDPRVTRIGRLLRLYRLDELPQLINVLRGD